MAIGLPFNKLELIGSNQCVPTAVSHILGQDFDDTKDGLNTAAERLGHKNAGKNGYQLPAVIEYLGEFLDVDSYPSEHKSLYDIYKEHGDCLILFHAHLACIVDGYYCDTYKAYLTESGRLKKIKKIIKLSKFE